MRWCHFCLDFGCLSRRYIPNIALDFLSLNRLANTLANPKVRHNRVKLARGCDTDIPLDQMPLAFPFAREGCQEPSQAGNSAAGMGLANR